jgi:hypothetical protein
MEGVELSPAQRSLVASLRASTLSLLLPSFNKALRRGLQTTMCCTCGPPQGDESALLRFIDSKQVTRDFDGVRMSLRPTHGDEKLVAEIQ